MEGRETALLNIDSVIGIIRKSDDPKIDLIKAFPLSEKQADDILEIRLRQLARMEKYKIVQELAGLRKEKYTLCDLLDNPVSLKKHIIREIEADRKKFSDARRTQIKEAQYARIEQKIIDEPVTVILSEKGWIRCRSGHGHDLSLLNFKTGDTLYGAFACRSTDILLAWGLTGRIYSVPVYNLPHARGDGIPITTLIETAPSDQIIHYFIGAADLSLLIATRSGYGFYAKIADMTSRTRQGKQFIALEENEQLLPPWPIAAKDKWITCLSEQGRCLAFPIEELRYLKNGGHGVTLMSLAQNETLLAALPVGEQGCLVACMAKNGTQHDLRITENELNAYIGKRAKKGRIVASRFKPVDLKPLSSVLDAMPFSKK